MSPEAQLTDYIADEHTVGRLLDLGVIAPVSPPMYQWAAGELHLADLADLVRDGTPAYAWDPVTDGRGRRRRLDSYVPSAGRSRHHRSDLLPGARHLRAMARW